MSKWLVILVLLFGVFRANAETPPLPDINGWKIENRDIIHVKTFSDTTTYLGFITTYQNPQNSNEYIRVYARCLPKTIIREKSKGSQDFKDAGSILFKKEEKKDFLTELFGKSDPFIYEKWQTEKDLRTGLDMPPYSVEVWFLCQNGEWIFAADQKIIRESISEALEDQTAMTGQKYSLDTAYHILSISRNDLEQILQARR